MKFLHLIILTIFACEYGFAQDKSYLVLQLNDKSHVAFELSDSYTSNIDFNDTFITVNWDLNIDYQNLNKLYISDSLPAAIDVITDNDKLDYILNNRTLYLSSKPNSIINIYSINGSLIYTKKLENGQDIIDLSKLSKGIYLLKINATSVKFQLK